MTKVAGFEYSAGNPFTITVANISYLIYLKNLSPAYFSGSPDITRLQLPYMEALDTARQKGIKLIVLGYDSENDCYVSWHPNKIRERINARTNVSVYARISIQKLPNKGGFNKGALTSGEIFIAFDRKLLPEFFLQLDDLFPNKSGPTNLFEATSVTVGTLEENIEPLVLEEINLLLQEDKVLEAATICYNKYNRAFQQYTIKDWLNAVTRMHQKIAGEHL